MPILKLRHLWTDVYVEITYQNNKYSMYGGSRWQIPLLRRCPRPPATDKVKVPGQWRLQLDAVQMAYSICNNRYPSYNGCYFFSIKCYLRWFFSIKFLFRYFNSHLRYSPLPHRGEPGSVTVDQTPLTGFTDNGECLMVRIALPRV